VTIDGLQFNPFFAHKKGPSIFQEASPRGYVEGSLQKKKKRASLLPWEKTFAVVQNSDLLGKKGAGWKKRTSRFAELKRDQWRKKGPLAWRKREKRKTKKFRLFQRGAGERDARGKLKKGGRENLPFS